MYAGFEESVKVEEMMKFEESMKFLKWCINDKASTVLYSG